MKKKKTVEKEVVFISRVSVTKTRKKGKEYVTYRVTIPMEKTKEIELNDGDYLVVWAKKAKWYHLLNWKNMKKVHDVLSEDMKREVEELSH